MTFKGYIAKVQDHIESVNDNLRIIIGLFCSFASKNLIIDFTELFDIMYNGFVFAFKRRRK